MFKYCSKAKLTYINSVFSEMKTVTIHNFKGEICNTDSKRWQWVLQSKFRILERIVSLYPLLSRLNALGFLGRVESISVDPVYLLVFMAAAHCAIVSYLETWGVEMDFLISQKLMKWPWPLYTALCGAGTYWVEITNQYHNQVEWAVGRITRAWDTDCSVIVGEDSITTYNLFH